MDCRITKAELASSNAELLAQVASLTEERNDLTRELEEQDVQVSELYGAYLSVQCERAMQRETLKVQEGLLDELKRRNQSHWNQIGKLEKELERVNLALDGLQQFAWAKMTRVEQTFPATPPAAPGMAGCCAR